MNENDLDDDGLPTELREVADLLRCQRHEAGALELDRSRRRVMKYAIGRQATKGGSMGIRGWSTWTTKALLLGALAFAALAALEAVGGGASAPKTPVDLSAAAFVYGTGSDPVLVQPVCTLDVGGATFTCITAITPTNLGEILAGPTPTGEGELTDSQGDTSTCTVVTVALGVASCTATFTPTHPGLITAVTFTYSGDSTYSRQIQLLSGLGITVT